MSFHITDGVRVEVHPSRDRKGKMLVSAMRGECLHSLYVPEDPEVIATASAYLVELVKRSTELPPAAKPTGMLCRTYPYH